MRLRTPFGCASIAVVVTSALTVATFFPLSAASASEGAYPRDGVAIPVSQTLGVPARDSQLGHGTPLAAGLAESIDLGDDASDAHSALVRLSVFDAVEDTALSAAGAPALTVPAGRSASTTVLVPVRNGELELASSVQSEVRVEALAIFAGDQSSAGATVALDDVISRPAGAELTTLAAQQILPVGVVGLGEVPAEQVRAVHLSIATAAAEATTLTIDGQVLPVAAGSTVLSTVVTPSGAGDIEIVSDAEIGLRVDVRGYVVEAPPYAVAINGVGSYWPALPQAASRHTVSDDEATAISFDGAEDAAFVVALVWADPSDELTMLELGTEYRGRARGGVVDEVTGAQPQLTVVPANDPSLTLRRGSTIAHVLELGALLAESVQRTRAGAITVDSPAEGTLELTDQLVVSFDGSIDTGDIAPLRIEVTRNGEAHGSASIVPASDEYRWSFATAFKDSGDYEFEFIAVGRDGSRSTVSWQGAVSVPAADAVMMQPDAVIMGDAEHNAPVASVTDDTITFSADPNVQPGNVIIAGVSPGAPSGFLRRVVAIDVVGDAWVVTTAPAVLTEAFLQAEYYAWQGIAAADDEYTMDPGESDPSTVTGIQTLPLDELDLAPLPNESVPVALDDDGTELGDQGSAGIPAAIASSSRSEIARPALGGGGGGGIVPMALPVPGPLNPEEPAGGGPKPPGGGAGGGSIQGPELGGNLKHSFKETGSAGGLSYKLDLTGELAYALSLTFELSISATWTDGSWLPPIPPLPQASLDKFSTILESTAKANVSGTVEFKAAWKSDWKGPKFTSKFTPITFAIGPVPVVITTAVTIELKAAISVSAVFVANFQASVQAVSRKGFRLDKDGKFIEVNEAKFTHKEPALGKNSGLKGSASAVVGPEIAMSAKLYDAAGPSVGMSLMAGIGFETKFNSAEPTVAVDLYVKGKAFVKISVTIPVIDYSLLDATLFEAEFTWSIFKKEWKYSEIFDTDPDETTPPDPDPGDGDPDDPGTPGDSDALAFAQQLQLRGAELLGAAWVEGPPHTSSAAIMDEEFSGMGDGNKAVLSTGSANSVRTGVSELDGEFNIPSDRGADIYDVTTLQLDLRLPAGNMCLSSLYFSLLTNEDPYESEDDNGETIVTQRDFFLAEWDASDWTQEGNSISAPHSVSYFAPEDTGGVQKEVVDTSAARNYGNGTYGRGTGPASSSAPVTSGEHSLYLTVADFGDSSGDTTVVISSIEFRELWGSETCTTETSYAR